MAHDDMWQPADGSRQRTADGTVYEGTVLEHILLENLCAFYDVGAHNELRLHNADWNDALDMAADKGESVAFTNAYAGNLHGLVKILQSSVRRRSQWRRNLPRCWDTMISLTILQLK